MNIVPKMTPKWNRKSIQQISKKHDQKQIGKSIEKWCPLAIRKAKEATVSPREPRGRPKGVHEESQFEARGLPKDARKIS